MRAGPLISILLGCIATIAGIVGVWQTEVPAAANKSWAAATDRLRNHSGSASNGIDAGYAAKNRRFAWGATAAFGVLAIALGISALRHPPKKPHAKPGKTG